MKQTLFSGVATALVTPFCESGVDFHSLGTLIELQIAQGVDALLICGTTGESATLSESEQEACFSFAVEKCAGRVPVLAGCGSNCTAHSLHLCRAAQAAGTDGLLLVTPYYNKASDAGLIAHYTKIADAVSLPILLYNVPTRTCVDLSPTVCATLSRHENIVGIKEAGASLAKVQKLLSVCEEGFSVYCGDDTLFLPFLAVGARGIISVASNLIPAKMCRLYQTYSRGEVAEAARLQKELFPLFEAMFCEVNPIPVKTALSLLGLCSAEMRLPLCPAQEATLARLRTLLAPYL